MTSPFVFNTRKSDGNSEPTENSEQLSVLENKLQKEQGKIANTGSSAKDKSNEFNYLFFDIESSPFHEFLSSQNIEKLIIDLKTSKENIEKIKKKPILTKEDFKRASNIEEALLASIDILHQEKKLRNY